MKIRDIVTRTLSTQKNWAPTVLRVALGTVLFAHGAQKAFGWFGGFGFDASMGFFTEGMGLPAPIALLVIAIELVGGLALIVGLGSRAAALGAAAVMVGAVATVHGEHGFFMNWFGAKAGEGIEYHLLVIAMSAGVILQGSGAASLDRWLLQVLQRRTASAVKPVLAHA